MKKTYLLRILCAAMIAIMATFAFAACDDSNKGTSDQNDTDVTTEEGTDTEDLEAGSTDDPEFDIQRIVEDAGIADVLPSDVDYTLNADTHTSLQVIADSVANADNEYDGCVATIMAYDPGDTSYEQLPDYQLAGTKYGIQFVISFATDLRYDPNDSTQTDDYNKLTEALKNFEVK